MQTRRNFIGNVATGLGSLATGKVLGANERVRFGVIGVGERGTQLTREALACPNAECVGFADVYTRRLEDAKKLAPAAKGYSDYRELLEDQSLDAVLIATPHHLHAEGFIAALDAGKHVYQEKTMAFTVDDAKAMRAAYAKTTGRTVQIGHQALSSGQITDASNYLAGGGVGKVTAIQARMFRNTPHGKPQWTRPLYPDMTPENLKWAAFQGSAPERDFDADRYANWRLFWDYSGGNVHENMCHQLAFWYKTMGLQIPRSVSMSGGVYLWKDGREVPDTMHVSLEHSEEILFSWDSGFGNSHPGVSEEVLGTDGTIVRGQQIRYLPQKVNRPDGAEVLGQTPTAPQAHMRNFFDCIRSGREPNCPFEIGYRVSIACRMAIASYWSGRTVHWDAEQEEIV
jgi:predicted dehydrogenase